MKANNRVASRGFRRRIGSFGLGDRGGDALALLLAPGDIPAGHWRVKGELAYRVFADSDGSSVYARAQRAKGVVAFREIAEDDKYRRIWTRLTRLADIEDAQSFLIGYPDRLAKGPTFAAKVTKMEYVQGVTNKDFEKALLYEIHFSDDEGEITQRLVGLIVGTDVVVMSFITRVEPWPWNDIASVLEVQVQKIRQ